MKLFTHKFELPTEFCMLWYNLVHLKGRSASGTLIEHNKLEVTKFHPIQQAHAPQVSRACFSELAKALQACFLDTPSSYTHENKYEHIVRHINAEDTQAQNCESWQN